MIRTEMLEVMKERKIKQMERSDNALLEVSKDCKLLQDGINLICDCYCRLNASFDAGEQKVQWNALGTSVDHMESLVNIIEKDFSKLKKMWA